MDFVSSEYDPRYFNRYAYSGNDPINNIDPDGQKIVPTGSKPQIEKINKALKFAKDASPRTRARIEKLDQSKNTHTIRFPKMTDKGMEGPANGATGDKRNASNGVGTGSETIVDPTQSVVDTNPDGSTVVSSGVTVLVHELVGHGGDVDQGTLPSGTDPETGVANSHISALIPEGEFKDDIGEDRREIK